MIDYIRSKATSKINSMHFIIGDTIMRNIAFFRNHEQDKYFSDRRNLECVQVIENLCRNTLPPFPKSH